MNTKYKYNPDYAVPPGATLQETIEDYSITQTELAKRLGRSGKSINRVINGKEPLTPQLALQLERILSIPASFWNSLEKNYREILHKLEDEKKMEEEAEEVKKFPYAELANLGLVEKTRKKNVKAENLLRYFAVASFSQIPVVEAAGFRIANNNNISFESLAAWLRHGEIASRQIATNNFDAKKLRENITVFKEFTKYKLDSTFLKLKAICAECGVAVVISPYLSKTRICGAVRWMSPEKPLLQLSTSSKQNDILWFTFFHELFHIFYSNKTETFIEFDNHSSTAGEIKADNWAANTLVPNNKYQRWIQNNKTLSLKSISDFAEELNIGKDILLGRLQHDKIIDFYKFKNIHKKIKFQF